MTKILSPRYFGGEKSPAEALLRGRVPAGLLPRKFLCLGLDTCEANACSSTTRARLRVHTTFASSRQPPRENPSENGCHARAVVCIGGHLYRWRLRRIGMIDARQGAQTDARGHRE